MDPETGRQAWDAANKLFIFLQQNELVLRLLVNQQISVNKAIESLCILRAGNTPALPILA